MSCREEIYAEALRGELVNLWTDLADACRVSRADPPEKSMQCEGLIGRIQRITRLVGPLPAEEVEMPFLLTGMYEKVHAEIGITATVPEETLQAAREYVAKVKRMTA